MKRLAISIIVIASIALLVGGVLNVLAQQQKPYITSITITEEDQSIFDPITVTFNKQLPSNILQLCSITTTPVAPLTISASNQQIIIEPTQGFSIETKYLLEIGCYDRLNNYSFITQTEDRVATEEPEKLQSKLDYEFAKETERVFTEQPWRAKLPIIRPQYTLTYSQSLNKYLLTLPLGSDPQQANVLSEQITQDLQEIGAPIELEVLVK